MEVDQNTNMSDHSKNICKDQDANSLPGYRFHPTDEELVRFYLRRKVENKPIRLDLIKQVDIYKHDPWDLPKASGNVGDKEWYFFCRRGKKYRNSIRPNRVTKSGFWKATGIDKPVNSLGDFQSCIGLKKSLVYYRGSAGKGTKTDWMMHEFRLPASSDSSKIKNTTQEAEVWTLCRILKRNNTNSCRKYESNWQKNTLMNPKISVEADSSSKTSSPETSDTSFGALAATRDQFERSPSNFFEDYMYESGNKLSPSQLSLKDEVVDPLVNPYISFSNPNEDQMLRSVDGNWDELRPMVDCVLNPSLLHSYR